MNAETEPEKLDEKDEIVKVEVQQDNIEVAGVNREAGEVVWQPRSEYDIMKKTGAAEKTEREVVDDDGGNEAPADEAPQERQGTGEGVNVKNMLPSGSFIKPEDVEEGDVVIIKGGGKLDDSFDQKRLILPVMLETRKDR